MDELDVRHGLEQFGGEMGAVAVTGRAAIVGLEHQRTLGRPHVDGVLPRAVEWNGTRHTGGAAMNHDEQRILLPCLISDWFVKDAFDRRPILALPTDYFDGRLWP